jgi:hypothetical protein
MTEETPSRSENLPAEAVTGRSEPQQRQHPARAAGNKEDILKRVRERRVVVASERDDDLLDPLERTVRYLVPIPRTYYWNANLNAEEQREIPFLIKAWHHSISSGERFGHWTSRNIGMPIAASLGLTESRFQFVLDRMDEEPTRRESDGEEEERDGQDVV